MISLGIQAGPLNSFLLEHYSHLKDKNKNTLLETIEDLKYQNNTNNEIFRLLENNIVKWRLKKANN